MDQLFSNITDENADTYASKNNILTLKEFGHVIGMHWSYSAHMCILNLIAHAALLATVCYNMCWKESVFDAG